MKEKKMTEETNAAEAPAEKTAVQLDAFFGVKAGMTRVFDESGSHVPVTVIKLIPNQISQVKTAEKEGYNAYQVAYFEKRDKLVSKPKKGTLKKAKIDKNLNRFAEIRTNEVNADFVGEEVNLDNFPASTVVDVTGTSKGKGFQGVIKRHNFSQGPLSHGSHFHRTGGSIGMCNKPGKIFKNRKMPGQMGNKRVTVQNTKVVELNTAEGYMLLKGSIPGSKNSVVRISQAIKK